MPDIGDALDPLPSASDEMIAQSIYARATEGDDLDRQNRILVLCGQAMINASTGHFRVTDRREICIFEAEIDPKARGAEDKAAEDKWRVVQYPIIDRKSPQMKYPFLHILRRIANDSGTANCRVPMWKAAKLVHVLHSICGVHGLNHLRRMIEENGSRGQSLNPEGMKISEPSADRGRSLDDLLNKSSEHTRIVKAREQGQKMAEIDIRLHLIVSFRAFLATTNSCPPSLLASLGGTPKTGQKAYDRAFECVLRKAISEDQLDTPEKLKYQKTWLTNRFKEAKAYSEIAHKLGVGFVALVAPKQRGTTGEGLIRSEFRAISKSGLSNGLNGLVEAMPGLVSLCNRMAALYAAAKLNPRDPLPDLRLFHMTEDIIDKQGRLTTTFSLLELLEEYQVGEMVQTPPNRRDENVWGGIDVPTDDAEDWEAPVEEEEVRSQSIRIAIAIARAREGNEE
ncbi:MAG: hypothetical protein M1823_001262 [Watsoniomyces obsoletus]|nr:MAG: hypothetical protein M1823_001262 [Watsoniomyces obsoletus]